MDGQDSPSPVKRAKVAPKPKVAPKAATEQSLFHQPEATQEFFDTAFHEEMVKTGVDWNE